MKEIIEKILKEVDQDIAEVMLKVVKIGDEEYPGWQLLSDPGNFILNWQALRDRVKGRG